MPILALFFVVSCSKDETNLPEQQVEFTAQDLKSVQEINDVINSKLNSGQAFNWKDVDDFTLFSAIHHGNNILTIGYGGATENFKTSNSKQLNSVKAQIIDIVETAESTERSTQSFVEHDIINVIDVKVEDFETFMKLKALKNIRYMEPNGYNHFVANTNNNARLMSTFGCDRQPDNIPASHYQTVAPNAKVSWNFYEHNIPAAWEQSTGAGVTVAVIDTGASANQSLLTNSGFNDGYSNGRTLEKYGTFIDSFWWWSNNYDGPDDKCGHGTAMSSLVASPRNDNGLPVGVAYNSNLIAYRATEDVFLNDYHERKGVSDALVQLANRSDVKIISMSIGYIWSIGNIRDAVKYAHSKGKLIFAAGGTSTSFTNWVGVIFPATMNEVVAVTGVTNGPQYETCETCHKGSKIDFTIVVEDDADSNKTPVVVSFYDNEMRYTGASSAATATTAGIAALIWSKYPNWTREQVLQRLKESSDLYPSRDANFGYGMIDALQAVQ